MRSLESKQIDASTFFADNDIDLTCRYCDGSGKVKTLGRKDCPTLTAQKLTDDVSCDQTDVDLLAGTDVFVYSDTAEWYFASQDAFAEWWKENGDEDESEEDCPHCNGSGQQEIIWNTIWNTGFSDSYSLGSNEVDDKPFQLPYDFGGVVAFVHEEHIWFGLSGCGQDMSPVLCKAWMSLFPDCNWLPEDWINMTNLVGDYYHAECGKKWGDRIVELARKTFESNMNRAKYDLERVTAYIAERQKKEAAKPKRVRKAKTKTE